MAEEAFALSPISARAALPSEEDYAAISEAFMETSRGRWFLGEYAKRNRNADTRMVLDAVARIEEGLATQKQAASDTRLTDALAAIRQAVDAAQAATTAALDGLALEQHLAPIHKGVRIIREISWRLREIGADSRICDILDSQVAAIEAGAEQISSAKAQPAVDAAFAALLGELGEYEARGEAQAKSPEEGRVVPFPAPVEAAPVANVATVEMETAEAQPVEMEMAEQAVKTPVSAAASVVESTGAIETVDESTADALDEAMLDLIAAEMSAPDPIADSFEMVVQEASVAEPAAVQPEPVAVSFEPVASQAQPPTIQPPPQPAAVALPEPPPEPAVEASLGSTIIASGMLRKPGVPANDPLAPIRRMSQAEKIAFFS